MSNEVFVAFWSGAGLGLALDIIVAAVCAATNKPEERRPDNAREIFGGRCPYTGEECGTWHCDTCVVEKFEREYLNKEETGTDEKLH